MSLKKLLGLNEAGISDFEIISRLKKAQKQDLDEVDFIKADGSVVKVNLPHMDFDPILFQEH
ncbi:hypothetical protein GOV06_03155 [Candidatus Woesearchaeota archaeon]|nr:hypothetical protein [Candidatus Woesearchaeota archaeon]